MTAEISGDDGEATATATAEVLRVLDPLHPAAEVEFDVLWRFRRFVSATPRPLHRDQLEGHVTASAFVLDPGREHLLLIWHRRLERWLQPGGHADGDGDLAAVARREVEEETGLRDLRLLDPRPFDLDIHEIPAVGSGETAVPVHLHYDARFLFEAPREAALTPDPRETGGARWFTLSEVASGGDFDISLRRVAAHLIDLLAP